MGKKITVFSENDFVKLGAIMTFPENFDSSKESLPMIVFLHGSGERGNDPQTSCVHGISKYFGNDPDYKGFRVITFCPQCPKDVVWENVNIPLIYFIKEMAEKYNVDKNRISLTGLSMGGYGSWDLAINNPDYFSCVAPICGGGASWRVCHLGDMPIRVYHGSADEAVPIAYADMMVEAVRATGGNVEYTVFEGVGHGSWIPAYEDTDLIEWLISNVKK